MASREAAYISLLADHRARRPGMEVRDLYKLLFQAIRGPEHLITSPQVFADRLASEWADLDPGGDDPLWESIRPDDGLLRLNLRPYKQQGGQLDVLVTACLETAHRPWGTQTELEEVWMCFAAACQTHPLPGLVAGEVAAFTNRLKVAGFPAMHHSERYRSLYRPAYRLVAADHRPGLQASLNKR